MDNSVACASAIATGVIAPCTTGVGNVGACGTMVAAGVGALPVAGVLGAAGVPGVANAPGVGVAPLSDVVNTWRSTISAALRSGMADEDGESDPDRSEERRV